MTKPKAPKKKPAKKKPAKKLFVVLGCHSCPYIFAERTPRAGYAEDFFCTAVSPAEKVDGYIEWDSEKRKDGDFPDFCPLEDV